jgi:ribosome maturation factor RimP
MIEERIHNLLSPVLEDMGFNLVQVKMFDVDRKKTLQIMAEKADETPLTVGDLEAISKKSSALLDVEDVISARYFLEVSSPGIDRPLIKAKDFIRFVGSEINIRLIRANDRGRKFKGKILSANEDKISFKPENFEEIFEIDFTNIDSAKLVITEAMLKKGK